MQHNPEVIIIGAGMAGLAAAKTFKNYNQKVLVLEASDEVGGRIRTDNVDGFLLDRGFQVFLTAYPEAKRMLDYDKLDLRQFMPGAIVLNEKGMYRVGDPLRNLSTLFSTLSAPVGTLADKLKLLKLKLDLGATNTIDLFERNQTSTLDYLVNYGFSDKIIENFFRPFFSGIFLEQQLTTSSRMFEFVFKMFGDGFAAVPAKGMGMIPKQLAAGLAPDELLLNEKVLQILDNEVLTISGKSFKAKAILIATENGTMPLPYQKNNVRGQASSNMYFSSTTPPIKQPVIALNASKNKIVNNVAVMDQLSEYYAPKGQSLVSVSLVGDCQYTRQPELLKKVVAELSHWYPGASTWKHLRTYHIPYALPEATNVTNETTPESMTIAPNHYVCGDYLLNGSINAAIKSGRLAAELIMEDLF